MALGSTFLKLFQTFLYAIEFCCAGIILGIYSYFLSVLADRNIGIPTWEKAVEGISGAAVLYLIFAVLLTCFLGGKAFFALLAIVLDLAFCAGFVAIAVLTRDGAHSCSGGVKTPLGNGQSKSKNGFGANGFGNDNNDKSNVTYSVSLGTACRLNTACFAVAILGAFLFLVSALVQVFLARKHKKDKRYGPGPSNNYTSGRGGRKFWQRKRKTTRDAELGTIGAGVPPSTLMADKHHDELRPSHETAYTGSTVAPANAPYEHSHKPAGYHTAPTGNAVNPYGYDNTHATPATNY